MTAASPWPDEGQALLIDAATNASPEAAIRAWDAFLATGRPLGDEGHWSLIPAVYLNLARHHGIAAFERREELRLAWMRTLLGNRQRFEVLDAALPTLAARGLPVVVVKGRAVLALHHGDLGGRPCLDADILVRARDFRGAAEALESSGFRLKSRDAHAVSYVDPNDRVVDLHGYMLHDNCWPDIDDSAWARAKPFTVGTTTVLTLADADHLVHTCAHGIRVPTRAKAYWLADALLIVRRGEVDWRAVVETVRLRRLSIPLGAALRFLRDRFGAAIPQEVVAEVMAMTNWADRVVAAGGARWPGTRRFLIYARAHRNETPMARMIGFCRSYSGARNPVAAVARTVQRKLTNGARRLVGSDRRAADRR